MIGPLSVQEAREQINLRLREIDEFWAAVVCVAPEVQRPPVGHSLTRTQRAVARMYAYSNLSAVEIARERFVSVNTVKTQIRQAYRALGVTRRSQLRQALTEAERVPVVPLAGAA